MRVLASELIKIVCGFLSPLSPCQAWKLGLGHSGRCEVRLEFVGRVSCGVERVKTLSLVHFEPSPEFVKGQTHHLKAAFLVCGAHIRWHSWICRDPGWSETEFQRMFEDVVCLFALLGVDSVSSYKDDMK